ncbi:dipeptidase PepV [Vulcanibacillus modesticaldus]|uniref:Dipeptidase PepV n=1 Tax=Vulcanibacillus modesticaldus TaxID=337097 RepID=A0A1D2YSX0_9BACI|nr:dipeptidase PepV [Vulcanibacillus modesticaldus]OEF98082.1 dipeptidase PepV [Vulcanibacillus modesticaldus]
MINWLNEVEKIKGNLVKDTQEFLRIKSVLDESGVVEKGPFGKGIKEALEFVLHKCEDFGMTVKNLDGYAGHAEIGQGDDLIGILCHVDVVPEGDGWTTAPYSAEIRDDKIYARGAIDDKGPTMAAIYAMKIIKDLGLQLNKRVRIIFGTDEETGWRGIEHYFKQEEMPTMGFAPDADFPIIIAEKGIANITLEGKVETNQMDINKLQIVSFISGNRVNMVPDSAIVKLKGNNENIDKIRAEFNTFLSIYPHGGDIESLEDQLILKLNGVSAHGMEPDKGVNAGLELINFLISLNKYININEWLDWTKSYLYHEYNGETLGIAFKDEITGALTVNPGILYMENGKVTLKLNIRYPVTYSFDEMVKTVEDKANAVNLSLVNVDNSKPHHVDNKHQLIRTLKRVYEEQTGEEAKLLSIGGGTYARALEVGVAFGPLFPGKIETAHQKDEHIEIDDLVKASAIYAQAIYELAK